MRLHGDSLPWQQLMEIAYGLLGISPAVFWQMTPPEWMAALTGWKRKHGFLPDKIGGINRADLRMLTLRFPDQCA